MLPSDQDFAHLMGHVWRRGTYTWSKVVWNVRQCLCCGIVDYQMQVRQPREPEPPWVEGDLTMPETLQWLAQTVWEGTP